MFTSKNELLRLAEEIAAGQGAPVNTVIKELLHYEILYALSESEAMDSLVFQGGTSIRLCHRGQRYSEDLDFACGSVIPDLPMDSFARLLREQMGDRYGLTIQVSEPNRSPLGGQKVSVDRWKATVRVPNPDKSIAQSQFINIEIASVPAYDVQFLPLAVNHTGLPAVIRQLLLPVESMQEILADKIVALGARPFVKYRDIWDIKFLADAGVRINPELVTKKLADYGWEASEFNQSLGDRIAALDTAAHREGFHKEMSRFVDRRIERLFGRAGFVAGYLQASAQAGRLYLGLDRQGPDHDEAGPVL